MQKFADPRNADYGKTDYYEDPSALKLISQTEWDVRSHTHTHTVHLVTNLTPCPCVGAVGPALVRRCQPEPARGRSARGLLCALAAHAKLHPVRRMPLTRRLAHPACLTHCACPTQANAPPYPGVVPNDRRLVYSHRSAANCEARLGRDHRSDNSTMGECGNPWHGVDLHELRLCMPARLNTKQRHQTHPRATPWPGRCRSSSNAGFSTQT